MGIVDNKVEVIWDNINTRNTLAVTFFNGKIYYVEKNCLRRYDMVSEADEFITIFPGDSDYKAAFSVNDAVWFLPSAGVGEKNICIYDLNTSSTNIVPLKQDKNNGNYANYVISKEKVWILYNSFPEIISIDRTNGTIAEEGYLPDWAYDEKKTIMRDAVLYNGFIYTCPQEGEWILKYDITSRESYKIRWNGGDGKYSKLCIIDNELFFFPVKLADGCILKLNLKTEVLEKYMVIKDVKSCDDFCAYGVLENIVWVFPNGGNTGYVIDLKKKKIAPIYFDDRKCKKVEACYYIPVKVEKKLLFFTHAKCAPWVVLSYQNEKFVLSSIKFTSRNQNIVEVLMCAMSLMDNQEYKGIIIRE